MEIGERGRTDRAQRTGEVHVERRHRPGARSHVVGVAHEQLRRIGRPELRAERPKALGRDRRPRRGDEAPVPANLVARDRRGVDERDDELAAGRVQQHVTRHAVAGQRDGRAWQRVQAAPGSQEESRHVRLAPAGVGDEH